jgi:hypothetical protein
MTETHDFRDLTAPRMNEAAWRAHDLLHAYAARDRAAIVEHLAHLEDDQLEFAKVGAHFCNDTRGVLQDNRCRTDSTTCRGDEQAFNHAAGIRADRLLLHLETCRPAHCGGG